MKNLFTSESVSEGHPDKVADQISDAILDAMLAEDPNSRVAVETMVTTGLAIVSGEVDSEAYVDVQEIVRQVIRDIGYTKDSYRFDAGSCGVLSSIHQQSPDIARGVNATENKSLGAGDQGMMFGYACNETPTLMPMPIYLAHKLTRRLSTARKSGKLEWLRPDGKSQVTVQYEYGKPKRVDSVLISTQHSADVSHADIREGLMEEVITPEVPAELVDKDLKVYVNPTGRFVIGGPKGDAGVTGRKIIVDTYGGMGRHGGGAFSGKDATKVDRSAAYAVRWAAKNVVAAGLAERCEIQVAYAIGMAQPLSINVETFGTGKVEDERIVELIEAQFDLRPGAIIRDLGLRQPIFRQTAAYGHFGRDDIDLPWENTGKAGALKEAAGL